MTSISSLFPDTRLFGKNIRTVAQGSWLRNSDMFEIVGRRGYYLSSGVGGSLTGSGASRAIIDDPVKNRAEANSATYRENVWDWYTSTLRTRLTPDGGVLLTCTRWHQDDLAGRLLAQAASEPGADQWTVIAFPAVAEAPIADYDARSGRAGAVAGALGRGEVGAHACHAGHLRLELAVPAAPAPA